MSALDDNANSVTESTLARLADSINQQAANAIFALSVPEFGGAPGEDVYEFLGRFKAATITLNGEMKCLAVRKALTGSAQIWARANLKNLLAEGNWREVKSALVKRFETTITQLRCLEKLAKLKFDPARDTLVSFLERAYKDAPDSNIILALKTNLPPNVQRGLNILNDSWAELTDKSFLDELAKRVEKGILAYDNAEQSANDFKAAEMTKVLLEVKDMLNSKVTENEVKPQGEAAAALRPVETHRPSNTVLAREASRNDKHRTRVATECR